MTLSLVEFVTGRDHETRKLVGCAHKGCPVTRHELGNHNLCEKHRDDHRQRNKKHMRIRRAMERVQLGLGL